MAKSNDIKLDDLLNLIANEVGKGATPASVRKYLAAIQKVILKELKLNDRIHFKNFGTFEIFKSGGYDRRMGDFEGGTKISYVKPKLRLGFSPSATMHRIINENDFEPEKKVRRSKSRTKTNVAYNERRRKPKPTMEELVADMINKK